MNIKEGVKSRLNAYRNPIYIAYAIISIPLFLAAMFAASSGVGPVEESLFYLFNNMSEVFRYFFIGISLFGSLGMVFVLSFIALARKHYANCLKILIAGIGAYVSAYALKTLDIRARPVEVLNEVIVREPSIGTHGFPSGHAAVATVLAIIAYQYIPRRWHRAITSLVILVFISRLYLGVHFPLDLVGGFAIGLFFGGVVNYAFGSLRHSPVPIDKIKKKLTQLGFSIKSVSFASVDARGSVPYIVKGKEKNYFVKVVSMENTVADWLFKLSRRAVYRRLEDEQPFLSPKRQLEHEAYVAMLAYQRGIQTPQVLSIFEAQQGRWALVQEMIAGKSLDSVDTSRVTDKVLRSIWQQIKKLHSNKIIHRDLRSANVFLDDHNSPWLIDFGFAEASIDKHSYYRDTVELVASLSLLVGTKRSVASAIAVLGKQELINSLPYLSYSSLSGYTTKAMKKNKGLLNELFLEISKATGAKNVKTVKLKRLNLKTLFIILALGIAFNVLIPQLTSLSESLEATKDASILYINIAVLLSVITYLLAGLNYQTIAMYPLKTWPTILVQVASSFTSKIAPAGTGGIALNGRYLFKNNHDTVQAGTVTALNTALGLVAHLSVVIIVTLFTKDSFLELLPDLQVPRFVIIVSALGFISLAISVKVFPTLRKIFVKSGRKIFNQLVFYKNSLSKVLLGYLISVMITLTYTTILYVCARALGLHLSVLDVVYVFTVGSLVATVTPTPGGIGGTEAALVASLSSIGVESSLALAITLLYRLITFWLPILPGFIAFRFASGKNYI